MQFYSQGKKNNLNLFSLFLHLSHFSVFLDVSYILELDGERYAIWLGHYTNKYASLIKLYLIFLMSCEDTSCSWKWWSYLSWVIQRVLNRYTTKKNIQINLIYIFMQFRWTKTFLEFFICVSMQRMLKKDSCIWKTNDEQYIFVDVHILNSDIYTLHIQLWLQLVKFFLAINGKVWVKFV